MVVRQKEILIMNISVRSIVALSILSGGLWFVGCKSKEQQAQVPDVNVFDAARQGNLDKVKAAVAAKPELANAKNEKGLGPLYLASQAGKLDVVEFLISRGASVNSLTRRGFTPLHAASERGHAEVVEYLLFKGAQVNAKADAGFMPLHYAVYNGHKDVAALLISKDAKVNGKNKVGWTSLHAAAHGGQKEIAELLIAEGANVNAEANDGTTPLQLALVGQHTELTQVLMQHGARISEKAIKVDPKRVGPIHIAVERGDLEQVKKVLGAKPELIDVKDGRGMTALHRAVIRGHKHIVEFLISKNADLNARDSAGKTPLQYAAEKGHKEIADLLRSSAEKKPHAKKQAGKPDVKDSNKPAATKPEQKP